MIETTLTICRYILYISIVFGLVRLIRGPLIMDRIMSIDAVAICIIGILVLESIKNKSPYFIDLILVFSLLNFVGVVAFVYYLNLTYKEHPHKKGEKK